MVIYISNWKKKIVLAGKILAILVAVGLIILLIAAVNIHVPTNGRWLEQEVNGQMVRQERTDQTRFDRAVDQFVVRLQDFYYEERE